jgi:hypothetical protein
MNKMRHRPWRLILIAALVIVAGAVAVVRP